MGWRPTRALDIAVLAGAGGTIAFLCYLVAAVIFGWPL